jgi:hypothetical protein
MTKIRIIQNGFQNFSVSKLNDRNIKDRIAYYHLRRLFVDYSYTIRIIYEYTTNNLRINTEPDIVLYAFSLNRFIEANANFIVIQCLNPIRKSVSTGSISENNLSFAEKRGIR